MISLTLTKTERDCLAVNAEDARIAERVSASLRASGYGPLRCVEVAVRARVAVLEGCVPSWFHKQTAQERAMVVPGVHRVVNRIAVAE